VAAAMAAPSISKRNFIPSPYIQEARDGRCRLSRRPEMYHAVEQGWKTGGTSATGSELFPVAARGSVLGARVTRAGALPAALAGPTVFCASCKPSTLKNAYDRSELVGLALSFNKEIS